MTLTLSCKVFPAIIGGGITYYKTEGLEYMFDVVITYTDISQDSILIDYGDGTVCTVGKTVSVNHSNYIETTYRSYHAFSTYGNYTVSTEINNWPYAIVNIPNSVMVPFGLKIKVNYYNEIAPTVPPGMLNSDLIDTAFIGQQYTYDPYVLNYDEDSIFFKLIDCLGEDTSSIPGYILPPNMLIDNSTGVITWNTPPSIGLWAIAFTVEFWQNGILKSNFIRQMTINVSNQSAISHLDITDKVNIFPNPTTGQLHCDLDNVKKIFLYNILGECVFTYYNVNDINLKGFEKGIYFIRIFTDNNMLEEKIILERN